LTTAIAFVKLYDIEKLGENAKTAVVIHREGGDECEG
jgi:hypothetical protein